MTSMPTEFRFIESPILKAATMATLAAMMAFASLGASATGQETDSGQETEQDETDAAKAPPLVVPVYPKLDKDGKPERRPLPSGADLRDSYIVMEDGSVLSVADWLLGSLEKNEAGADMSDYQTRLFLGQVARALAGEGESLTQGRTVTGTGDEVGFNPPPDIEPVLQAARALVGVVMPGTPVDWHPAKSGGAFSPLVATGGNAAILFEGQFYGAMIYSVQDMRDAGTYRAMLERAKKAMGK